MINQTGIVNEINCFDLHPYHEIFQLMFHPSVDENFKCSIQTPTGSGKSRMITLAICNFKNIEANIEAKRLDTRNIYILFGNDRHENSFINDLQTYKGLQNKQEVDEWLKARQVTLSTYGTFWTNKRTAQGYATLEQAIYICDESHIIWSPEYTNTQGRAIIQLLRDHLENNSNNCAILLISGTPSDQEFSVFKGDNTNFMDPSVWKLTFRGLSNEMYPVNKIWRSRTNTIHNDPWHYIHVLSTENLQDKPQDDFFAFKAFASSLLSQTEQKGVLKIGIYVPGPSDVINTLKKPIGRKFEQCETKLKKIVEEVSRRDDINYYMTIQTIQDIAQWRQAFDLQTDYRRNARVTHNCYVIDGTKFKESVDLSGLDFLINLWPVAKYDTYKQIIGRVFRGCKSVDNPVTLLTIMSAKYDHEILKIFLNDAKRSIYEANKNSTNNSIMGEIIYEKMRHRPTANQPNQFIYMRTNCNENKVFGNLNRDVQLVENHIKAMEVVDDNEERLLEALNA